MICKIETNKRRKKKKKKKTWLQLNLIHPPPMYLYGDMTERSAKKLNITKHLISQNPCLNSWLHTYAYKKEVKKKKKSFNAPILPIIKLKLYFDKIYY